MTVEQRPRAKRLSREQRREALLDAAAEIVVSNGIDAVTMEGVAAEAQVSKALPYAYFDNANQVLEALFAREMGALDAEVAERMRDAEDFDGRVRATLEAWFDTIKERGVLVGALLQPQHEGPVSGTQRRRDDFVRSFWTGLVCQEYDLDEDQAKIAAAMMIAGSQGLLPLWLRREVKRQKLIDTFVHLAKAVPAALEAQNR